MLLVPQRHDRHRQEHAAHIASDTSCDSCHTASAWKPALRVDHNHVTGTCNSCHDGAQAPGKPASHIPTTAQCGDCHSTLAWLPAAFDHAGVTSGCRTCHDGTTASGPSTGHMTFPVNNFECNHCHTTTAWSPNTFRHVAGGGYPGDHRVALSCTSCHAANTDAATWRAPAYKPDCAGCHASRFKPDPHKKYGDVKYTVSELRNCSGACHVYTSSTLTTILTRRSGPEHRITDDKFD